MQLRQVMLAAEDEKQKSKDACLELTRRFIEEKRAFEEEVMARAESTVQEVRRSVCVASRLCAWQEQSPPPAAVQAIN